MPHITLEYPSTIADRLDIDGLAVRLHQAAAATGTFAVGGIRTFARPAIFAHVGNDTEANGFIQIQIRIAPGRSTETKKAVLSALFEVAQDHLRDQFAAGPFAVQLELSEFDPTMTVSRNNMIPSAS